MSTYNDREKGEEAKYARHEELEFKVMARRNKLLGLWAAEKLGLTSEDAVAYAKQCVMADFEEPGDEDVYRFVMADLEGGNAAVSEHDLRRKMERLIVTAREELENEAKS
jgi:hypothetical protein